MSIHGNWDRRRASRREFLGFGGAAAALLASAALGAAKAPARRPGASFGELVPDPNGLVDLPSGFTYEVISLEGTPMSSGAPVPGDHDGMAAFRGRGNSTVLARNHELSPGDPTPVEGANPYDPASAGGTTAVVLDKDLDVVEQFVTSSGTTVNCAGGATPWGTWITCEEDRTANHGYCFEVMWDEPENDLSKTPIREMGFFSHEAIDVDPRSGVAYLTEDDFRGTIDPNDPNLDTRFSFSTGTSRPTANAGRARCRRVASCRRSPSTRRRRTPTSSSRDSASASAGSPSIPPTPTPPRSRRERRSSTASKAATSPAERSGSTTLRAASRGSARCSASFRAADGSARSSSAAATSSSCSSRRRTPIRWRVPTT
jgi:hypothetical protein